MNQDLPHDPTVPGPSEKELAALATRLNYSLSAQELKQCHSLITDACKGFNRLDHLVEQPLPVKYPRTPGYRPCADENPYNAWYWKSTIQGAATGKLSGKTITVKDHIMVAGVPMMAGCHSLEGTVPDVDATVITRLLDAGGTFAGKAVCSHLCFSDSSFSGPYGNVSNVHDKTRTSGGSSNGCAVLVVAGDVDMAIAGGQAGSIEVPSSWNGCVGLKPTWGRVPCTGSMSIEPTLDTIGPMARTVHDCALLLEVIAGYDDGLDHRQPPNITVPEYSKEIEVDNLNGIRVGILQEGFEWDVSDKGVNKIVRETVLRLESVGAQVRDVSIPLHKNSADIIAGILGEGAYHCMLGGGLHGIGYKGFYPSNSMKRMSSALKHDTKHIMQSFKIAMLKGAYLNDAFHGQHYGRCQNLARLVRKAYDDALKDHDVLIMPTIPFIATKRSEISKMSFEENMRQCATTGYNSYSPAITGHPSLSINAGWQEELPVGMQIVGRHWEESTVLKVARAHEKLEQRVRMYGETGNVVG